MKREQTAYIISIISGLFMAILGFTFSYISSSQSIYLDGLFSLVNMAMAIITLILSRKILGYKSERFQFGISQAEPILNTIKAIILLVIMLFSGYLAIDAISNGGRPINFDTGILYALIAALGCFFTSFLISIVEKHNNSPMLTVERKNWFIDGVLSSAVLIVFGVGYLIQNSGLAKYSDYIDPLMMILLLILVLPIPIKIFKDNFFDLLFAAPSRNIIQSIEKHINSTINTTGIKDYFFRTAKYGRFYAIHISLLVKGRNNFTPDQLDTLRTGLNSCINKELPNSIITIETAVDKNLYQQINEQ